MEAQTTRRALSVLAIGGISAAAIATGVVGGDGGLGGGPDEASALEAFSSCDELQEYARDHEWANAPYPYATSGGGAVLEDASVAAAPLARDGAEAETTGAVGPSETGTNTQEVGIDEPDIAKLSGTTLFRIKRRTISALDVAGEEAVLLGELELDGSRQPAMGNPQLLLADDKALVIATGYDERGPTTTVTEIDVTDPTAMEPLRVLELEGTHVNARLQGTTARLVIESQPAYDEESSAGSDPQTEPSEGSDPTVDAGEATGATGETGPQPDEDEPSWLPQASLTDLATEETETAPIANCSDIAFPEEFSGLGLLSVLTIDLESGLLPADVDAIVTDGTTVYASATGLYVATMTIAPPDDGVVNSIGRLLGPDSTTVPVEPPDETAIHRFDTTDADSTEYAASGEVRGTLIGQFAMSEEDGFLRVASTTPEVFAGDVTKDSESFVTVLEESEGTLDEVGRVGGLGPGEDIYAVRFIGNMGYVVTFEQTDPLYTVDLSAPEDPEVTGELKIPGYSAYLHPVADGRLLGIGQDGTSSGTITGAQASLFDVADPAQPERLDQLALSDGRYSSTATEWDHHAFLYSPEHQLAVVPVAGYRSGSGATAFLVDPNTGFERVATITDESPIQRILVVDQNLVTVSENGVEVRPLGEL
ncbi:MAG TPA: beta-propeller domain-containing protein [Solirubrobacterales bacterium]|nr:beta-propeller domain-containing protein [Solirubrobacterales bacterium]